MEESHSISWIAAIVVMGIMVWVAMDTFTGWIPWHVFDPSKPDQKKLGIAILVFFGATELWLLRDLLHWVWMGLQHILGLDLQGVADP